jgi:hypothetical protein
MHRVASALLVLALALTPKPADNVEARAPAVPEHLASTIDTWKAVVVPIVNTIWNERRGAPKGEPWKWTDPELAHLQAARASARETIAVASAEDRPWLLVTYIGLFGMIGLGSEWADAILEVPPKHPAWSTLERGGTGSARARGRQLDDLALDGRGPKAA